MGVSSSDENPWTTVTWDTTLRIPEADESRPDLIELRPDGAIEMELVHLPKGYGITTPMSFEVDDVFMIGSVQNHRHE